MVPRAGIEPARPIRPADFKSAVSTNFTTPAGVLTEGEEMEARAGVEPAYVDLQSSA